MKNLHELFNTRTKIYTIIQAIGIVFLTWFITTYAEDIIPEYIKYPELDNQNVTIQTIDVGETTYEYARTNIESPTLGQLLDASGLNDSYSSNIQTSEQAAQGEVRDEIILQGESRKDPLELLMTYIEHLEDSSVIISYNYSDYTAVVMNNRLNEELQEDSNGNLQVINAYGDLYSIESDGVSKKLGIQNVQVLKNVLKMAQSDEENVEFKAVDAGGGYVQYQVTFNSVKDFVNVYEYLSDEDKSLITSQILDELAEQSSDFESAKVCFEFIAGNDWQLNVYNTLIIDGTHVLNWYFQGFYETFDWRLSKDLYSSKLNNNVVTSVENDISSIKKLMDDYSKVEINYETGEMTVVDQ